MDDALQQQIFTPFFTTRSQGTGLGLAAVASVVRAHQGSVEVSSAPGQGSCFSLWLPLAQQRRHDEHRYSDCGRRYRPAAGAAGHPGAGRS
ncbi:ATP-binding protein [Oceanimonas sp. NS1]|nr:ATP-binding protein [Oceanimonas sp. NS1]